MLDDSVTFLNHGSFGARLRGVAEVQQEWRNRFEAKPVEYFWRRSSDLIAEAKVDLGRFLGMNPANFGFVVNATDGISAVLRSLRFEPGDELLTTNHVYPAVRLIVQHLAEASGARHVELDLPLPIASSDVFVEAIEAALTDRTRLVIIDHVTSPTALLLPVEQIIDLCNEQGIDVLVDGAHGPGMLDLDVEALNPTYYTGNLHKWVCAPSGAAMLWVRPDRQTEIHPTVISHFFGQGLAEEFAWQGTRDLSAWLAVPEAIRQMDELAGPEGWSRIRLHNNQLAKWAHEMLCENWKVKPISPADGSMLRSMTSVTLPDEATRRYENVDEFQLKLYDDFRIEVPVYDCTDRWVIRSSCQVYNTPDQYEHLARAVTALTS